jgi:hypothetical protein
MYLLAVVAAGGRAGQLELSDGKAVQVTSCTARTLGRPLNSGAANETRAETDMLADGSGDGCEAWCQALDAVGELGQCRVEAARVAR